MSGDNFHFGDNVGVHGGTGNIGVNHGTAQHIFGAGGDPDELRGALAEVRELAARLRGELPREDAEELEEHLATAADASAGRGSRRGALRAVAGIVTALGDVATPLVEAVNRTLALFGRGPSGPVPRPDGLVGRCGRCPAGRAPDLAVPVRPGGARPGPRPRSPSGKGPV
jgi:hypothetical protein